MTTAAQSLITAPIARKIMAKEAKGGHYLNLPTMGEIENFYWQMKGFWSIRDLMVRKYTSMTMLEPPFGNDKDAQQDPAFNSERNNDRDEYSVDPSPFDTVTQAISMAAKMRAYANPYPTDEKHTSAMLQEYGKFGNAILDMYSKKRDYIPEDMSRLINTGWLIKLFPFDPVLQQRGEFPFQIESPSPLGVYPDLDVHGQVLRVCIERRLTGSQLLENYAMYPGVREMFDDEFGFGKDLPPADSTIFKEWGGKKCNLLTTQFNVVRYYDRVATAILIDGASITETAAKYNTHLKALRDGATDNKKKLTGIYTKAKDRAGNPWYGVSAHNLGRVPMVIEYCWPEIRDANTNDPDSENSHLGGLPLMYSGFTTWREISRYFSMLQNLLLKTATAPIVTNIENFSLDSDVINAEGDQKAVYLQPPQVQQQLSEVLGRLQQSWDKGTFASALFGKSSATSGRQENMVINAGGVRFDHVVRKIGRAWSGTIEGVTDILRERGGDEPVKAWGFGKKYDGQPYVQKFKAVLVGDTCPGVSVELKRVDAMTDPERIALFKTADGIIPAIDAYDQILEVPNPQQMFDALRQEKIDTEQTNLAPAVRIGALKKELEVAKEEGDLTWKLQKIKDEAQHAMDLEQAKLDLSQLPEEEIAARQKAFIEEKLMKASTPPGQSGMLGSGSSSSSPFSAGPGPTTQNGPPPNFAGNMPPISPMPTGAQMNQSLPPFSQAPIGPRPPMPMPMMPPRPVPFPMPTTPPGLGRRVATAPGQAQQPIQPLSRFMPSGGVGAPGVGPRLVGPQGLPGQPVALPRIEAANQAVAPIGPLPGPSLGKQRNGKRRRAGR